jgi:hypothetical protein
MGCLGFLSQPDSELGERVETGGAIGSVRVGDEILVLHRGRSYARSTSSLKKKARQAGLFREADEGTRTLDLLHGKPSRRRRLAATLDD